MMKNHEKTLAIFVSTWVCSPRTDLMSNIYKTTRTKEKTNLITLNKQVHLTNTPHLYDDTLTLH